MIHTGTCQFLQPMDTLNTEHGKKNGPHGWSRLQDWTKKMNLKIATIKAILKILFQIHYLSYFVKVSDSQDVCNAMPDQLTVLISITV